MLPITHRCACAPSIPPPSLYIWKERACRMPQGMYQWRTKIMSNAVANPCARLLLDPVEMQYDFGPDHPMNSQRLQALLELLAESNLWHAENELTSLHERIASEDELRLIHTPSYIDMIQRMSAIDDQTPDKQALFEEAERYGIEEGDTPA